MDELLESINRGIDRYDMQQLYPISGNVSNAVIGQNRASGLTTFQWQDSANWWSPSQSYFSLILTFQVEGIVPIPSKPCTYADNFVMTLFSQLQSYINSRPLDTVNTPHLIDTALTYSNARKSFIDSWGSLTRIGEPLSARLLNVQKNAGVVEVVFRPPLSIFDVALLPPGAQFRIDFNWANNGINAFESIYSSLTWNPVFNDTTTANAGSIRVESFSFYKATVHPDMNIAIPERGVINLSPCQALQYFLNAGSQLKQNITLPSTTNRILIGFQDLSTGTAILTGSPPPPPIDLITGIGSGYRPATSFTNVFCTSNNNNNTYSAGTTFLQQLWLSLPELGIQEPNPVYNFSGVQDYMRAYGDFCSITQGTKVQKEGSVPFGVGLFAQGAAPGVTIIQPSAGTTGAPLAGTVQIGNINNPQQYIYIPTPYGGASAADVKSYNQTSLYGWAGRCPGPIFAFPVVRPEGKTVTTGTLNAVVNTPGVSSISATVIASYSMAIALELQPTGYYSYTLIEGV